MDVLSLHYYQESCSGELLDWDGSFSLMAFLAPGTDKLQPPTQNVYFLLPLYKLVFSVSSPDELWSCLVFVFLSHWRKS